MKRAIKKKIMETSQQVPNYAVAMEPPPQKKVDIQPPLPLEPPPSDSPLDCNITVKKEIEDTDYQSETFNLTNHPPDQIMKFETIQPQKKICRDFVRGTCTRPVCRHAHKIDVTQLRGVYTFCRNFQNGVCNYPNCKYVHATIFEEQAFYRTGILPERVFSHHKQANVVQPPLPAEKPPKIIPNLFSHPPPTFNYGMDKPVPMTSTMPTSNIEVRSAPDDYLYKNVVYNSPSKQEWGNLDDLSSFFHEPYREQSLIQKCKTCDITALRLKYNEEQIEKMIATSENLNKDMEELDRRKAKLRKIMSSLLNLKQISRSSRSNPYTPNVVGDRDMMFLDQLATFMTLRNQFGDNTG